MGAMGFRKTPEEREAVNKQKEHERWLKTPVGRAITATQQGRSLFQIELDLTETAHIEAIEGVGWRLEHVGYVWAQTGVSQTSFGDTSSSTIAGVTRGVYMFRR